ncbi:MAG: hypothetical protein BWY83_02925 [bacterium ADurb.Bin478]|nr:MAG: hypothetical protein BWY83_02925 [bacterium ADurb.Bin478]
MVQHDVLDHGQTAAVRRIDKAFELRFIAIVFVRRKVKGRVIPPAVVAFEFVERHDLQSVNAQAVEISQRIGQAGKGVLVEKIAQQQFIDDQLLLGRTDERRIVPIIRRRIRRQGGNDFPRFIFGIGLQVAKDAVGNRRIIPGIEHKPGIGIGDAQVAVDEILKGVLLARLEVLERQPETRAVRRSMHEIGRQQAPVIEFADDITKGFVRRHET